MKRFKESISIFLVLLLVFGQTGAVTYAETQSTAPASPVNLNTAKTQWKLNVSKNPRDITRPYLVAL
ncbi:hypothetical protein AA0X95_00825 [Bacillus sp. 1P10SD]|uniref:hypothetical protein n=1 Tax=Bacillus sp. 1P10SD TaxID=3132265 RepID=UPI0039A4EFC7